ncbi:glycosyltransferase family 1 protein [Leucobacter iarius]|uniref:Glycosyltransferase family 4 protein n=1 Tax=Leucobacter iarius TaxID=333963 RepID=A0ABN2LAN5_9MICO
MNAQDRPRLLILSLSNISMDARVLRQVRLFADEYRVTTCGFGPQPIPGVEHIELGTDGSRFRSLATDALIRLRAYRAAYWMSSIPRIARRTLRGRAFDAVLANDLNTVMLALSVAEGNRIHFDLHEFFPGTDDNVPTWVKHRLPYLEWQLRRYAVRGRSWTAVSEPIAERYAAGYGLDAGVVVNASPYLETEVQPAATPLRFVYSGIAQRPRKVELVMHAVAEAAGEPTLDLFLTGEGTPYHDELLALADELGPRIRVLPPVPQHELTATLRDYDIGIPILPLEPTNLALALPNKLFDYVQARLGVVTGPNESMARIVLEHGIGAVTDDFELQTLVDLIGGLTAEEVSAWKRAADAAAVPLSAEQQNSGWERAIAAIVDAEGKVDR